MRRTQRSLGFIAALWLGIVGCSGSGDDSSDAGIEAGAESTTAVSADGSQNASSSASSIGDAESSTTTSTGSATRNPTELQAALTELLLAPADLGPGFIEVDSTDSEGDGDRALCPGTGNPDVEFPPVVTVERGMVDDAAQLGASQALRAYDSASTATSAFEAVLAGFSCGAETADPSMVSLGVVSDVSDELGTTAAAVEFSGFLNGVIIVATYSDVVAFYQFEGAPGAAEAAGAPDPAEVVHANIDVMMSQPG
jgi:hypothetical protein